MRLKNFDEVTLPEDFLGDSISAWKMPFQTSQTHTNTHTHACRSEQRMEVCMSVMTVEREGEATGSCSTLTIMTLKHIFLLIYATNKKPAKQGLPQLSDTWT